MTLPEWLKKCNPFTHKGRVLWVGGIPHNSILLALVIGVVAYIVYNFDMKEYVYDPDAFGSAMEVIVGTILYAVSIVDGNAIVEVGKAREAAKLTRIVALSTKVTFLINPNEHREVTIVSNYKSELKHQRYVDSVMREVIPPSIIAQYGWRESFVSIINGFEDQHGTFYTREVAWQIAMKSKQVKKPYLNSSLNRLFMNHLDPGSLNS